METSILTSTKKVLGIAEAYTAFDLDILTHINSTFSILDQLGIGPPGGFYIEDKSSKWEDFSCPPNQLQSVKTYMFLKVRFIFDPPTMSYLLTAMSDQINQFEWRLNVMREDLLSSEEILP